MPHSLATDVHPMQAKKLNNAHRLLRRSMWIYAAVLPLAILPLLGSYSPALLAKLLVLIALANHALAGGRGKRLLMVRASILWVVIAFLSAAWSSAPGVTIQQAISLLLNVVVVLAICRLTSDEVVGLLPPLAFSSAILGVFVLRAPSRTGREGRAGIGGVDENVTAFVLAIGFAVAAGLIFQTDRSGRLFNALAILTTIAALLHLGSRSGVVALALTVVVVYAAALRVSAERFVGRVLGLVVAFVAGFWFLRQLLAAGLAPERVARLLEERSVGDDSDRSKIVDLFLGVQDEWWLFGVGYGADADFLRASRGLYLNMHSQFWASWVELGIAGLVILAVVALCWVRTVLKGEMPLAVVALFAPVALFAITLGVDKVDAFWFVLGVTAVFSGRSTAPVIRGGTA